MIADGWGLLKKVIGVPFSETELDAFVTSVKYIVAWEAHMRSFAGGHTA